MELVKKLWEENLELRKRNLELQAQLKEKIGVIDDMEKNADKSKVEYATNILRTVFTPGQVKKILPNNTRRIKWTVEDITSAIALRSVGSKSYNYLRDVKNIPLPCVSTLRNWISNFQLKPGTLHEVLHIMSIKGKDLAVVQKLTVLTFDEIYILNKLDLERREQKIYGPHKTCQVVMARGLFSKWKQPVFYNYSTPMSKDILLQLIKDLYSIGYTVVAVACDMGGTNVGLWAELKVGASEEIKGDEKVFNIISYFEHPSDKSLKVFTFADVSHLIKLLRNNFFDHGFLHNDDILDKTVLEELLKINSQDLKIAFNLSREHLDAKKFKRQQVKLAAQVFSRRNSKAVQYCGKKGLLSAKNWQEVSEMLQLSK